MFFIFAQSNAPDFTQPPFVRKPATVY